MYYSQKNKVKQNHQNSILHWFTTPLFPGGLLRARLLCACALNLDYRRENLNLLDKFILAANIIAHPTPRRYEWKDLSFTSTM